METKTVLVVDDTFIWLATAEQVLKSKYTVLKAENGKNCILTLTSTHVDLVLLDMEMPGMNGIETLAKIRSLPGGADLPVIMLTGDDYKETIIAAARLSVAGYLTKPYMPADLLNRVGKALG
ncbi:MAG: response regulator [Lachnospiraceae bacterium]|nr:response regulator [Lachnospiraceae bacterium]